MDAEVIWALLKVEGDVLAIAIEEPSDSFTFIMPVDGQLSNWTWVGFSKNMGMKFCNASSDLLFNIFNKMNSDLAYFDVSHNIEILHLIVLLNLKIKLINNWKIKVNLWNQLL